MTRITIIAAAAALAALASSPVLSQSPDGPTKPGDAMTGLDSGKGNTGWTGGAWAKAFGYFLYRREEFLAHYHKRSNVETTFSMIKAKFGERLRCKTTTAQINEALCKVLCHNLCCVIQSMYELGVDPTFGVAAAS